jgi:hypothetical protein
VHCAPFCIRPNKKICVFTVTCQTNIGSVGINYFFFIIIIGKTGNSHIRFRYFIFKISGKPSFVEAVLWRITQFFYFFCSQFRQKSSGWINKTLLLIKQQKWLQGLKLAVAHSPFASKFQCGPLKISSQSSTWRVKIGKNKIV